MVLILLNLLTWQADESEFFSISMLEMNSISWYFSTNQKTPRKGPNTKTKMLIKENYTNRYGLII